MIIRKFNTKVYLFNLSVLILSIFFNNKVGKTAKIKDFIFLLLVL